MKNLQRRELMVLIWYSTTIQVFLMPDFEAIDAAISSLPGEEFLERFGEIAKTLYTELDVLTFAFILYDESTPEFRKLLRDRDYRDALDAASGEHMVVFALSDDQQPTQQPYEMLARLGRTARQVLGLDGIPQTLNIVSTFNGADPIGRPSQNYSRVLRALFDQEQELPFPSVLFFQVVNEKVFDYHIVSLERKTPHESCVAIQELFQAMNDVLAGVQEQYYGNQPAIFNLIKNELENRKFKLLMLRGPQAIIDLALKIKKVLGLIP